MVANANHGQRNLAGGNSGRGKGKQNTTKTRRPSKTKGPSNGASVRKNKVARKTSKEKQSIPESLRAISKGEGDPKPRIIIPDTNALMHNPGVLNKFNEHPVVICGQVWYEMDGGKSSDKKRANSESSKNVRDVHNYLDQLTAGKSSLEMEDGLVLVPPVGEKNGRPHTGKIFFDFYQPLPSDFSEPAIKSLDMQNKDNRILLSCLAVSRLNKNHQVILVTSDRNFRVKARRFGIDSEEPLSETVDYQPSPEEDVMTGFHQMDDDFWDKVGDHCVPSKDKSVDVYQFNHAMFRNVYCNQFLILPDGIILRVTKKDSPFKITAKSFDHHDYQKILVPRNHGQIMALELLKDPNLPAVVLGGAAGSGKTYLALQVGMHGVEQGLYDKIIVTRSLANVDEEIGFLPGTEEEKMSPWLAAFTDNLEAILGSDSKDDSHKGESSYLSDTVIDAIRSYKIQFRSLNFMRGRSFTRCYVINDESQNSTLLQMRTATTRIGEGSKIVHLGNAEQIDNKFLTAYTCGLSAFIRRAQETPLVGNVTLQGVVRSEIAEWAEENLK